MFGLVFFFFLAQDHICYWSKLPQTHDPPIAISSGLGLQPCNSTCYNSKSLQFLSQHCYPTGFGVHSWINFSFDLPVIQKNVTWYTCIFIIFVLLFETRVSLCAPGYPGTQEICLCLLGSEIKVCTTTAQLIFSWFYLSHCSQSKHILMSNSSVYQICPVAYVYLDYSICRICILQLLRAMLCKCLSAPLALQYIYLTSEASLVISFYMVCSLMNMGWSPKQYSNLFYSPFITSTICFIQRSVPRIEYICIYNCNSSLLNYPFIFTE